MAVDALSVATVGFQSSFEPSSFALCIATEGYQCEAATRRRGGGGLPDQWCVEEPPEVVPEELAALVWNTVAIWNHEVRQTSRDLAATVGLKAFPGGESLGSQFAAVVALTVSDEEEPEPMVHETDDEEDEP